MTTRPDHATYLDFIEQYAPSDARRFNGGGLKTSVECAGPSRGSNGQSSEPLASERTDRAQVYIPEDHNPRAARLFKIHALQAQLTSSPWAQDMLELAMATATSLPLSAGSPLVWLMIVGNPGSGKTQTVLALRKAPKVYPIDSVTENFLASGYRDPKTGKPAPNLLAELDGTCVIIKDLSTLFSLRSEI